MDIQSIPESTNERKGLAMRDLPQTITHPSTGKQLKRVMTLDRLAEMSHDGGCVYNAALEYKHFPLAFIIGMTLRTVNEWLHNHGLYEVTDNDDE